MPIMLEVPIEPQTFSPPGHGDGPPSRSLVERERRVLAEIAAGKPLGEVLEGLLRAVEAQAGHTMRTSVLFLSEDGRHLHHGAAPSLPDAYNAAIDGIAVGEGVGSCGTVASRGTPVYAADIATDPLWVDFRGLALEHGLRACWSTPIQASDGGMLGTFAIYYGEPRTPTPDDVDTIAEVTQTAALAIERARSDQMLRRSEQRLNALIQSSSEVRYTLSADWGEMRQLVGGDFLADTTQANSNWLQEYIPPEDREVVRAEIARVISAQSTFHLEHRINQVDGTVGWALSRAVPLLDPEGNIKEWFGAASDITARRRAEIALRELNETLEQRVRDKTKERDSAWRLSNDLLVVAMPDGTLEAVNARWTEVLGWTEEELSGTKFVDYTHPDDLDATLAVFASIFTKPLVETYAYRFRAKDGRYRWLGWTASFEDGRVYASGRDLTHEREQAEALRQSQKMEAVGQLTGGLAHDFNNLLAGISGSLELMQTRMQQGRFNDVDRYMTAAQGAAKRAAALTHRLLAFSRRQTLDPKPIDVNRLVAGMQELVQRTVGPGIPIEVVGASSLWPALVDPSQLENALLNLCINARDAMPDGGRITIETANKWFDERAAKEQVIPEGQYLSLAVTDTGTGMSAEVIARVFEPFFTTKPIGEGTGLGLSMIYGFAKQSGGQVRIYSEVGKGTTVCIYLPRYYGEVEDDGPSTKADALPRSEQGETVLIVDDEPTVRMLVTDILAELGYTAIEAGDSVAGLKVLQSDVRIDLLVTDVGLPGGMNGRQMADAARVARPDLKVLFITGYAENAILGNGHLAPGMAVLTKPFPIETMAARIRSMIEGSKEKTRRS